MSLTGFVRRSLPLLIPMLGYVGSVYLLLITALPFLDPNDRGPAVSALSLFLVFAAAPIALQARSLAGTSGVDRGSSLRRNSAPIAIVVGSLLVATPVLSRVLDLPLSPLFLLAPSLLLSFVTSARLATRSSWSVGAATIPIAAAAATRLIAGIVFAAGGSGVMGLTVALLLAECVGMIAGWSRRRPEANERTAYLATPSSNSFPWPAVGSFMLLADVDLLLVNRFLVPVEAGRYAAVAVQTRVLLLVPLIVMVIVARVDARRDLREPLRWLHRLLAISSVVSGVVALALIALRPLAPPPLGSERADVLFPALAFTAMLLGLIWQLSSVHVVAGSRGHLAILLVVVAEIAALAALGPTARTIAFSGVAAASVGLILHYVGARAIARWSPPLSLLRPYEELDIPTPGLAGDAIAFSVILPCYNPGPGLEGFLRRLTTLLRSEGPCEVIVVSDGSTDDSVEVARRFPSPSIRVIHYPERVGKGHALRVGLRSAHGSYVGFIDADGEIDPDAIGPLLSLTRLYDPDMILGSKRHPMSQVAYPPARRIMSWVYHKLTRIAFRVNARDTQTGLKVIRRDVLRSVLPRMFEKRYAFDLELLVVARLLGFTRVFEAPVRIQHSFTSTVDLTAVFRILLDTAAIFYRRYVLDTYRHAGDRLVLVRDDLESPADEDRERRGGPDPRTYGPAIGPGGSSEVRGRGS